MSARIGKLQKVPLRDIWPGEAPDFTTWLAENLDLLGEALGLRLSLLDVKATSARLRPTLWRSTRAAEENRRIFDTLCAKKEEIEGAFGGPLVWDRMEGRRACRVRARLDLGGLRHRERWPEIQEAMIDAMVRLSAALQREIQALR